MSPTRKIMMRFDLHIHSDHSDGKARVHQILAEARKMGLNGLAITDHNTLAGSLEAKRIAVERYPDLIIIQGAEVNTSEGHLLILGVDQLPPLGMSPEATIEAVRDLGGITVLPHPYHLFRHAIGRMPPVDAVEVYNSKYLFGISNFRAKIEARKRGMPMVAGSDSHMVETVGLGITLLDAATEEEALEEIRRGRTDFIGHRTPTRLTAGRAAKKVYKRVSRSLKVE
mgnify:CR=1 FL=1